MAQVVNTAHRDADWPHNRHRKRPASAGVPVATRSSQCAIELRQGLAGVLRRE